MKRAFPQKVKSVLSHTPGSDVADEQSKQGPTEVNRKACTSAAMIGLAISMGASSLLLPRQNDRAVAAEPLTVEPSVATVPAYEVAALSATPEIEPAAATLPVPESSAIKHSVQPGQTLWQIARLYQVDATAIATANGIAPSTTLEVGQILQIPSVSSTSTSYEVASAQLEPSPTFDPTAELQVNEPSIASVDQAEVLKEQQDIALDRLKQKRDELKNSLAELRSEEGQSLVNSNQVATAFAEESDVDGAASQVTATASPETPLVTAEVAQKTQPQEPQVVAATEVPQAKPVVTLAELAQVPTPTLEPKVIESKTNESSSVVATAQGTKALKPEAETQVIIEPQVVPAPSSVVIPEAMSEPQVPTAVEQSAYRVGPGDTLDAIARNHGISRAELIQANRISDPNYIRVNQVLTIPQVKEGTLQIATTADVANGTAPTLVASTSGVAVPTMPVVGASLPSTSAAGAKSAEFRGTIAAVPKQAIATEKAAEGQEGTKVATAPLSNAPFSEKPSSSGASFNPDASNSPYINNLKSEIIKLREKYRATGSSKATATQANVLKTVPSISAAPSQKPNASPVTARQVNPEFSPSRYTEALQAEIRTLQQKRQSGQSSAPTASNTVKPEASQKLVAAAPLGSDSYDPLVKPLVGQTVSPDLPPLAAADRYLPENAASFKGYIWPAKGVLSSGYGWRWGRMHKGIDIAAPVGTPVVAAASGVVITAGWNEGGYGNLVEIQHPDGSVTLYAHNNRILVRSGQQVDQGQQIAEMGSTGYSTGPHSHFELHAAGQGAVNPMKYLASR
ncbi:peptidoglycan DD-metalloendopeptidase family protein [Trichocoleus sp. FACHB-262]|uniref:peptidoglycan DD-metalloendopeptidase family protein n=1 Tax=Trichocoleus sp. FACHB-262 TaxID=2692869 RepID=UPI0016874221|nr:peptidoglycan DD-metalloendopeptidase family protein [Trichocoleus sp. FACHB-262]